MHSDAHPITLYAPFHAIGIRGNITFHQELPDEPVSISVHLISTQNSAQNYSWAIHSNPVFYGTRGACNKVELGSVLWKLSDRHGPIVVSADMMTGVQEFIDPDLKLRGPETIWGRSILLSSADSSMKNEKVACSNIFHGGNSKTSEAVFTSSFAGKVIFRENELGETMIYSNLFHTTSDYRQASKHEWKLLVTDLLDTKRVDKCKYLSTLFDPDNVEDRNCNPRNHTACKMGDLVKKHGLVTIGSANNRYSKFFFVDNNLPLSSFVSFSSSRQLFLAVYEKSRVLSCAQVIPINERDVKADFNMDGVKGFFRFSQRYILDPTVVTISLQNLMGRGKSFRIHEFPVPPKVRPQDQPCSEFNVGGHFNPIAVPKNASPAPGQGTNDQYAIGDLSGKYGLLPDTVTEHHLAVFVDMNLPLFGSNSIVGRSVLMTSSHDEPWICSSIGYSESVVTAVASFHYPIYGKVIMRQLQENPWSETSVFADLSYSDATVNDTDHHAWNIFSLTPGRDFYNWSRRCNSVGDEFNPFEVGDEMSNKNPKCSADNAIRCAVGDLTSKSRRISISAFRGSRQVKVFYQDILLPLSGPHSVVGRSLVIHDENGPSVRGNRLACAPITRQHAISAAVRKWRVGSGVSSNVSGSITFYQSTAFDRTYGKAFLHGLNGMAGGYHVHEVWVPGDKEFPCSNDCVYGHYNPLAVDVSVGPLPGASTSDQYEVGDLSGKFGPLDYKAVHKSDFVDTSLPLHGVNSIIGRSVVVHKMERNARWVCGTIWPEVSKDEGKEVVAIASFDNPRHSVSGFVRFRQFEYKSGGTSPTWLEVELRYPGQQNRNVTEGHEWAIFVNQVGEDAFNSVPSVRCLASGYRWNPFLAASGNKNYQKDCSPANPLRCEMGDMTGKHGHLTIGSKRLVLADENLPLTGNFSIMHRSIVIMDKKRSNLKLACANIKPDAHLVSSVAVRRHPSFTVATFMDHMRQVLDTSSWLVSADLESVKLILDGECVQITIHFYGECKKD